MTLSTRSTYGLRALFILAKLTENSHLSLSSLAKEANIPYKYLEQVFILLRKAGLVIASTGSRGGYRLARQPNQIKLGQVVRALDGTIAPVSCVSRIAYAKCSCPDEDSCSLRAAMEEVRSAIIAVIDNKTLADYLPDSEGIGK